METLVPERLARIDRDRVCRGLVSEGNLVFPLDGVRIEDQLVFLLDVVKDRHLAVANHD